MSGQLLTANRFLNPVPRTLRFIQLTDPHLYGDPAGSLRGIVTLPALQATLTHAQQRYPVRDGVLLTGDLVQDDPGGYLQLRKVFADSKVPVYCLPGNHDVPAEMSRVLHGRPFQVGGSVLIENWLIVLLDTWAPRMAGGRLGAEQLRSLDELLNRHADRHALLCLHHQPIPMESRWLDTVGLEDAPAFLDLVRRHDNVRGVLWGHVHQSQDRYIDGVRFMATPATCAQFLPRSDVFALDLRPPGYRVVELTPDGLIASEVVWVEAEAAVAAA